MQDLLDLHSKAIEPEGTIATMAICTLRTLLLKYMDFP